MTYVVSASIGIAMAHSGSRLALSRRDAIVGKAVATDAATISYRSGRRARAALLDATANLVVATLPQTLAGLTVVLPYVTVSYQGWVGGIVSVDGKHASRFRTLRGTAYYLGVLFLQFLAFSLCIGAGIRCGVTLYTHNQQVGWRFWRYRLPPGALADLLLVIGLSLPVFLVASSFEFLCSWNT